MKIFWPVLAFLLAFGSPATGTPDGPRWYYLGPHTTVKDTDLGTYKGLPVGTVGSVDLSSATKGDVVFISSDVPFSGSPEYVGGFTSLDTVLTAGQLAAWQSRTGAVVQGTGHTLLDVLWLSLTEWDAPFNSIMPTREGFLELHLGGHSLIRSRRFGGSSDTSYQNIRKIVRRNYRKVRQHAIGEFAVIDGITLKELQRGYSDDNPEENKYTQAARRLIQNQGLKPSEAKSKIRDYIIKTHRKYLATQVRKLGVDWRDLIPPDLPEESPITPTTTFSDDFNRSNNDVLGGSWNEINGDLDIISNRCEDESSVESYARYDSDLSSDDHYVQCYASTTATFSIGPVGRCSVPGTDTAANSSFYMWRWSSAYQIYKRVSGSFTLINGSTSSPSPSNPELMYLDMNGSTITCKAGGTTIYTETDTGISGNLRCGIRDGSGNNTTAFVDDWECSDGITGISIPVLLNQYRRRFQ